MLIHAKLKLLRHHRGYNQEDVARFIGISVPAYSKIETGITDLNYSRIEQLAALYQLTPVQLLNPEHDPLKKDDALLLKNLERQLAEKEQQVSEMQSRLISLHERLSIQNAKKTA